jgi:AraC-type DNA-binding domain-containing proteins
MVLTKRTECIHLMLQKLMIEEKVFTRHGLNRKTLSIMLNTNEKYLHDLIKEVTGMSCSEYINSLRINHACRLLEDTNNKQTIDAIADQSGFSSRKTFYRQFRECHNMSPAQYRNAVLGDDIKDVPLY